MEQITTYYFAIFAPCFKNLFLIELNIHYIKTFHGFTADKSRNMICRNNCLREYTLISAQLTIPPGYRGDDGWQKGSDVRFERIYGGLTYDKRIIDASIAATEKYGTGCRFPFSEWYS